MQKIKFLNQEKIEDLFSVIKISKGSYWRRDIALFQVGYFCGLRVSEVGLLVWENFYPRTKSLYVTRLKGGKSKMIRLDDRFSAALDAWRSVSRYTQPFDAIFASRGGGPLSRSMCHLLFNQYSIDAKIHKSFRHWHVLRHSIAVHLLDSGVDIEDVRSHLGHVRIQNTLIYAQYTSIRQRRFNQIVKSSRFIAR